MRYCDLHSDALTAVGARQTTKEALESGGCLLQCFAAFVSGRRNVFSAALSLCDAFYTLCEGEGYHPVADANALCDGVNAMLTVEGGEAIEGSGEKLNVLSRRGVKMMTLVWNEPNEICYPAFPDYCGLKTGRSTLKARETKRGLTPFGRECVARMNSLHMIIDVSHASDRTVREVGECSQKPFVASHSGAQSVFECARNLRDEEIRVIAEHGGVVGLNFCADFLSDDKSADGQKNALLAHARAIVRAGGVDCLAFGSDFDGIPENAYMKNPSKMPRLLSLFDREFGVSATEKFAFRNVLRVLSEV